MRIFPDGMRSRPGDERGFIHKSIIGRTIGGVVKGFVSGGPLSAIRGGVSGLVGGGGGRRVMPRRVDPIPRLTPRRTLPRTETARVTALSGEGKELGRQLKFGNDQGLALTTSKLAGPGDDCIIPFQKRDPQTGECRFFLGDRPGPDTEGFAVGEAVMGQYGAGLRPGSQLIDRAICLRGMQLGNDGVCYNKSQISNKQRMWPAGRKPLLSGGDMRAISIAARAGKRLERTTKRLQGIGLMKKPAPRRVGHAHARPVAAVSVPG